VVLLAHAPSAEQERYLAGPLAAFTAHTVTDAAVLRRRLAECRRTGYAWARDEFVEGISSVAAPITGPGGHVVAAVHAHGPTYRFPPPGRADEIAERVAEAGRRIGARLAGQLDLAAP
jgi:DNA-binding IclR family transcriptional regulator